MADSNAEPKTDDVSSTSVVAPADDVPFLSEEIDLETLDEPQQLGHGETQHISTLPFRKCSITTKITDLRRCYFRDGRNGGEEKKREACVIFFELEFGSQVRGSGQRITECGVWVMFEEVEEDDEDDDDDDDDGEATSSAPKESKPVVEIEDPDLDVKATYPRLAHGPLSERSITNSVTAELNPNVNSISVGSISIGRETARVEPHWASYVSGSAGSQGIHISLTENSLLKTGIPHLLRFAVLLRTDGLPFNAELRFKGSMKQFGIKVGAKKVLPIGKRYLWFRQGRDDLLLDGDADSEGFKGWVKSKTGNSWAEKVEYD